MKTKCDLSMKGIFTWILGSLMCISGANAQREVTILDHKDRIRIQKMDILNSPERETNISISPDGKFLFFCSFRGGQFWSRQYMYFQSKPVWDGDIWYSEKVNGNWREPQPMHYGINTSSGEDEPNISPDGSTVYYQSWLPDDMWKYTGGPYYSSKRNGKYWGRKEGLGGGITAFFLKFHATDGMTISPDGKTFIVAAGHDYEMTEKMDLYISRKVKGEWTLCKRLPISTRGNERSVFMAGDGKTLYFASDGYKGYGGMDIFKTTLREDGSFGEVINIGKPFNTPDDDYGFILTQDGNEAYFLRDGNIFFADLKEADDAIKPGYELSNPVVQVELSGVVKSRESWENLVAQVVIIDKASGIPIKSIKTTDKGTYRIELTNKQRDLLLVANSTGYEKVSRSLEISPQTQQELYQVNFLLPAIPEAEPEPVPEEEPVIVERNVDPEEETSTVQPEPEPEIVSPPPQGPSPEVEKDPYDFSNVAANHLILLLDVSSSMNEKGRLPLLQKSFEKLLSHLRERDRISVVVYSGDVHTVLENASAKEGERILSIIQSLQSGGSTLGQAGLLAAYRVAMRNYIRGGNNRIIMATDGEFSINTLIPMAEKNAKRKISLSVFAFENQNPKLKELAEKGGGYFTKITPENVEAALLKEATAVRKK